MGNKNVHDVIHGKLQAKGVKCLDKDKMAKLLFKVPVFFQSPTGMSKMFLIIFVFGTGNMYFLSNLLNGIRWNYYNVENLEINFIP